MEHKTPGYVGPMARILARPTAGRSRTAGGLCSQLALSITDSAERERFRRDVEILLRSRSPGAAGTPQRSDSSVRLPEHELERVQEALTQFVGPIARVLVRRATADASSVEALRLSLSNHIEAPAERSAFLRQHLKYGATGLASRNSCPTMSTD